MKTIPNSLVNKNNKQIRIEQVDAYKKLRKIWGINPQTKVKKSKKAYNRQLTKREINKIRKGEDY